MLYDFIPILASLGVIQALFLSLYFFNLESGKRIANIMLALVLCGLSLRIGKSIFNHYFDLLAWHRNIGLSGVLLAGPAFWYYCKLLVIPDSQVKLERTFHFAPAVLFALFSSFIPNERGDLTSIISYSMILLHLFGYLIASYRLLFQVGSFNATSALPWCKKILAGLTLLWVYYTLLFLNVVPYYIGGAIFYTLAIYGFSYMLMKRQVFVLEKYSQSEMNHGQLVELVSNFKKRLEAHSDYLQPKFSLKSAAELMDATSHQLSQAINSQCQTNFSDFINSYRIKHAKSLLLKEPNTKIEVIGLESGFGNSTSFNTIFKREVGLTPSEFRKTQQQNLS